MKTVSEPLSVYEFGKQLLETRDLDPVYLVAYGVEHLERGLMCKWLIAYWCFYHCGTASWIVDQKDYWEAMMTAAGSKEYPRSSERRHFRGQQASKAVFELAYCCKKTHLSCAGLVSQIAWGPTPEMPKNIQPTLAQVMDRVKALRGFGEWIAFKVADMLERLGICPVLFKPSDVFNMFDAPRKGAEAMAELHGPPRGNTYMWAYNKLKVALGEHLAPPRFERSINIQEIETILCKWKSHLNGHYEVGKDIKEVRHGLSKFKTPTAARLLKAGVETGLWE